MKYEVKIMLSNGRVSSHVIEGDFRTLTAQIVYVENNIDVTGTFFCGKPDTLIALDHIVTIVFEEIK